MTFEKLSKIMIDELGTDKLSDIALEFNVSPQVVSNWKSRDQVPYKYVKQLRQKIEKNKSKKSIDPSALFPNFNYVNENENENDDDELLITFINIAKLFYKESKKVIIITFSFVFLTYIYTIYIKTPFYTSKSKIIPISIETSNSSIGTIAQRFGVNLSAPKTSSSLTSSEMFPEIIMSRSLMESLLDQKFDTREFGENRPLISIILEEQKLKAERTIRDRKRAVSRLLRKINVNKKRNSPLLTLRTTTKEPDFSAELLKRVIQELVTRVREHKLSNIKKTSLFINNRLSDIKLELENKEESLKIFREGNRMINSSPTLLLEQERMIRDLEVASQIYGSLKIEYEKSKIEESRFDTVLEILDAPEAPLGPANINLNRSILIALFGGFFFSLSFIYFQDLFITKIKKLK